MATTPTLILTPRFTDDSQALWRAAGRLGWGVERLTRWDVPEELREVDEPVLYLEGLFGPTLAEQFGLRLLEPPEDWLPSLPEDYRKRDVHLTTMAEARLLTEPRFIKPPNDKSFPARACLGSELPEWCEGQAPVLVSEVVRWEREYRFFVLDRESMTGSIYLRDGCLQREREFFASDEEYTEAEQFLKWVTSDPRAPLPKATVIDVGVIAGRGWAVVEQNAAWASGIYGCDPLKVLEVLRHAAVPRPS